MAHKKRQISLHWVDEHDQNNEGTSIVKNKFDLHYDVLNGDEISKTVSTPLQEFTSDEYTTLSDFLTLMDNKINTLEN